MKLLARLGVRSKILLLVGVCAAAVVGVAANDVTSLRGRMMETRLAKLRAVVDNTLGIAKALEADAQAGRIERDQAMRRFHDILSAMRFDNGRGYPVAYNMAGTIFVNSAAPQSEGKRPIADPVTGRSIFDIVRDAARDGTGVARYSYPKPGETTPTPKVSVIGTFEPWNMYVFTGDFTDDLDAQYWAIVEHQAAIGGSVLLAALVVAWLVSRDIVGATVLLQSAMARLAGKELGAEVPGTDRRDEIGAMARSVLVFRDGMVAADRLAGEREALKTTAAMERKAELARMAGAFEATVGGLAQALSARASDLQATARSLTDTAARTSQQASNVTSAADSASAGVQTVAAAAEELSASIGEISRQVAQSSRIAGKAVEEARRTDGIVRTLAEGAEKIGQVVQLISNIAGQTNLLALNATIEAARAGDAGKGFVVVASEVKSLALQTAKATGEIGAQIEQNQTATADAVRAIREIGATIEEVSMIATAIAAAVEEQGAATAEIARNVQRTAQAAQQVTHNIAGVSQASDDTGTAAGQLLDAASGLSAQTGHLSGEVDRFLKDVRAA